MNIKKVVLTVSIFLIFYSLVFSNFHPQEKWREVSNDNFIIIYPLGYHVEAQIMLGIAREQYQKLTVYWGSELKGKVRIVLNPFIDSAQGSATFFPYNIIKISLYPPPPDSIIGNFKDWKRYVLSHELTHVINMNFSARYLDIFRRVFGHNPLLFPFAVCPLWFIEGCAVMAESDLYPALGRLNTADYHIILSELKRAEKVPELKQIYGDYSPWPYGETPYLFGGAFFEYLKETYGQVKVAEFVRFYSKYILALYMEKSIFELLNGEFLMWETFFGKNIFIIWDEFRNSIPINTPNYQDVNFTALTKYGGKKTYPFIKNDGKIGFFLKNYLEYDALIERDIKNQKDKRLFKKLNISGVFYDRDSDQLYFSANQFFKAYYYFSDLYTYNFENRQLKRLSKGKRLFYPVKLDNNRILCVKRVQNKAFLNEINPHTGKEKILSKGFESISFITLSPDQKSIAAAIKKKNKNWSIAIFSRDGSLKRILTDGEKKAYYPIWNDSNNLFFIQEYKQGYYLAAINLKTNKGIIYDDNRLPSIKYINTWPDDSNKLLVCYFNSKGYDLGILDLIKVKSTQFDLKGSGKKINSKRAVIGLKEKKYRRLRDLVPKYFTPAYRTGGNELQPGIFLNNMDVLSNHNYYFGFYYGFTSQSVNLEAGYNFKLIYPSFSLNYSDLTNTNLLEKGEKFLQRNRSFKVTAFLPLMVKERFSSYLFADIHFKNINENYLTTDEAYNNRLNGYSIGFYINSVKRYYDSISDSDGLLFSLSLSRDIKSFGSNFNGDSILAEYKHYLTILRPNVLAVRAGFARSWGEIQRVYYLGGTQAQSRLNIAPSNIFNLMRGYPAGYFYGTCGYIFNFEYRISLAKLFYKFFIITSMERLYLTIFTDIGQVWQKFDQFNPSYSYGMELNMLLLIVAEQVNLTAGMAMSHNPYHSPIFYLRIKTAF